MNGNNPTSWWRSWKFALARFHKLLITSKMIPCRNFYFQNQRKDNDTNNKYYFLEFIKKTDARTPDHSNSGTKFITCNKWILLGQILLIKSLEIKSTRVLLRISMNPTGHRRCSHSGTRTPSNQLSCCSIHIYSSLLKWMQQQ